MLDVAKLTNCELELLINVLNVAPLPSDRENISVYLFFFSTHLSIEQMAAPATLNPLMLHTPITSLKSVSF